jgi:threonine/homoserine/homoserine lactone efflux protein
MNWDTWCLFSGAALVVILIPGPLSLLMVSNSLNYGLRRSIPAFAGGVSASIGLLTASALGLGALLAASEQLFSLLKVLGALYLFYLGWQSWVAAKTQRNATAEQTLLNPSAGSLFTKAFVLGASNPKDLLFFAAFLPQFISPSTPIHLQLMTMIATWAVLDLCCKLFYGVGAQKLAKHLRSERGHAWFNRISAGLFGGAGALSLLSSRSI